MKILFVYTQTANNTLSIHFKNGADSSLEVIIDGVTIPQIKNPDAASQDVCSGDESLVMAARTAIVALLNTRWGKCPPCWGRQVTVSTRLGELTGSTSSCNAFRLDKNGDLLIEGFRMEKYHGAFNAMGQGTGYSLPGWTDILADGDWEISSVESTLGNFKDLRQYMDARELKFTTA